MKRYKRHKPSVSKSTCARLRHSVKDEHKGGVEYRMMFRRGRKEHMARSDARLLMQAGRDERKHERWMKALKKKYCR